MEREAEILERELCEVIRDLLLESGAWRGKVVFKKGEPAIAFYQDSDVFVLNRSNPSINSALLSHSSSAFSPTQKFWGTALSVFVQLGNAGLFDHLTKPGERLRRISDAYDAVRTKRLGYK